MLRDERGVLLGMTSQQRQLRLCPWSNRETYDINRLLSVLQSLATGER
jgi:hypothetical protein